MAISVGSLLHCLAMLTVLRKNEYFNTPLGDGVALIDGETPWSLHPLH